MTDNREKKPIVVVLAMHRTGSSALTRGLGALGLDLGDRLMPPVLNNNETGFWEDLDLNAINERVLAKIGSSWDDLEPLPRANFESDHLFEERCDATAILREKSGGEAIFAFKDPRTAILSPFWRTIFHDAAVAPQYVVVSRSPLEVALSLQMRDGFPLAKGILLWAKYQLSALGALQDQPATFVSYDRLIEQPVSELGRLAHALDLPQPETAALDAYVETFLNKGLRHNVVANSELDRSPLVPELITELASLLDQLSSGETREPQHVDQAVVERLCDAFDRLSWAYAVAGDFDQALAASMKDQANLRSNVARLEALNKSIKRSSNETREEMQRVSARAHCFEDELGREKKRTVEALEKAAKAERGKQEAHKELQSARSQLADAMKELTASREAASEVETALSSMREETAKQEAVLQRRADELSASLAAEHAERTSLLDRVSKMERSLAEAGEETKRLIGRLSEAKASGRRYRIKYRLAAAELLERRRSPSARLKRILRRMLTALRRTPPQRPLRSSQLKKKRIEIA